jgi:hypothetical protein
MRTYMALAKGDLWLFMDIYPWLCFVVRFGINRDGTMNAIRMEHCVGKRDWNAARSASPPIPFMPRRAVASTPRRRWA